MPPSPRLLRVAADAEHELVRRGYDAISYRYRSDDAEPGRYAAWLAGLQDRLPAGASVLDVGCGCGVPVARSLAAAGHQVTGIDISDVQIERARRLVPAGTFIRADVTTAGFRPASFDAVVCLYSLIHIPLDEQPGLLRRVGGWLRPRGWLLAVAGQRAWTGAEENWLGGQATMWWSQADAGAYRGWLEQAGLEVTEQGFVPEGDSGHALFWARRRPHCADCGRIRAAGREGPSSLTGTPAPASAGYGDPAAGARWPPRRRAADEGTGHTRVSRFRTAAVPAMARSWPGDCGMRLNSVQPASAYGARNSATSAAVP